MYLSDFAEILSERQDIREEHQHKMVFSKSSRYGRLAQAAQPGGELRSPHSKFKSVELLRRPQGEHGAAPIVTSDLRDCPIMRH